MKCLNRFDPQKRQYREIPFPGQAEVLALTQERPPKIGEPLSTGAPGKGRTFSVEDDHGDLTNVLGLTNVFSAGILYSVVRP